MRFPLANLVLAIAVIATLVAYPFRQLWWGELAFHIFGAAMIGGFADWYAVTALFQKPLGIPFKTAILPRSKARLVKMAQSMVAEELLRVSHMYTSIKREGFVVNILSYLLSLQGQEQVREFLQGLGKVLVAHIDWKPFQQVANDILQNGLKNGKVTPLVVRLGSCLLEEKTMAVLWLYVNRACQRVVASEALLPYLRHSIATILQGYSQDSIIRSLALTVGGSSLSPDHLAHRMQVKALETLRNNESLDSSLGSYVWTQLQGWLDRLQTDEVWQYRLEAYTKTWLHQSLETFIRRLLRHQQVDWNDLLEQVLDQASDRGQALLNHPEQKVVVDRCILFRLLPLLRRLHGSIHDLVGRELSKYSAQDMSQMVRSRFFYDLQMVRINGAFVGAVLGGLLYGITRLLKEVLG